jgi:hypothetical protein
MVTLPFGRSSLRWTSTHSLKREGERQEEYQRQIQPAEAGAEEAEAQREENQHEISLEQFMADRGPGYFRETISFTWEQFQELYALVAEAMTQRVEAGGPGARPRRTSSS